VLARVFLALSGQRLVAVRIDRRAVVAVDVVSEEGSGAHGDASEKFSNPGSRHG
jgi:hypothetical protein